MSSALDQAVRGLRRRIALGTWIGVAAQAAALLGVLGASLVLLARALFDWPIAQAAWLLAPVALAPLGALFVARRRRPSDAALLTWLDVSVGARGLVVSSSEQPDPRWFDALENELAHAPEPPALRVGAPGRRFLGACAFALAALFVPLARPAPGPAGTLYEQLIAGLTRELATLDEVLELDDQTLLELTERLGRLAEQVGADVGREGMLEAIDALSEQMREIAGQATDAGSAAAGALARAAAEAMNGDPKAANALVSTALRALGEAGMQDELPAALAGLLSRLEGAESLLPHGEVPSGETLREWSAMVNEALRGDLSALGRAGLVPVSEQSLERMARSLAELVEGQHACDSSCAGTGICSGGGLAGRIGAGSTSSGQPGRGGVTRGRADAQLTWGEESPGAGQRFAARALPPARAADPEHSAPLAVGATAPTVEARGEAAGTGAEVGSQGAATWRRRLAPRHRAAVEEFFAPSQRNPR